MRFGVMAMQMASLVPADLGPEEMQDYASTFDHAELVRGLHQEGFALIELGGDLGMFIPQAFRPPAVQALGVLKEELGLAYTVHLPLWSVEPSTPLRSVREGSVAALVDAIEATYPLKPEVYVIHATGALAAEFASMRLPAQGKGLILRQFQQAATESLRAILIETGLPSRQLAVETIEFPFELTLEMAEALDLSMCLDVGHVLSGFSGQLGLFEVLDACVPRLAEVHLHDAPIPRAGGVVYGRDHRPLGEGDLDVGRFLDRLEELAFEGPVIFELTVAEAKASLALVASLRPHLVDT
ncbi:MAG: cobamide remodeling phosphodiesterase CbiR [Anaerolineae bacterium]